MAFTTSVQKTGKLVLVRHGESTFNQENRFGSWVNVDLTDAGRKDSETAAELLSAAGFEPDAIYSSPLRRALETAQIIGKKLCPTKKVVVNNVLVERFYGDLVGMNKDEAEAIYGAIAYKHIHRGYDTRPQQMYPSNPHHPHHPDLSKQKIEMFPEIAVVLPDQSIQGESLKDVVTRLTPFWKQTILPKLQKGENVMISSHSNCLRAMSMLVEQLSEEQIITKIMPNAEPVLYDISVANDMTWKAQSQDLVALAQSRVKS